MFKLLLLLFLGWLAFRMIRAGRFVMGIVRGVENLMAEAQGQQPVPEAPSQKDPVTVHVKKTSTSERDSAGIEDARFEDL